MLSSEGKEAALQTVGLAAADGNSPHVFAIRRNKKKRVERRKGGGGGGVEGRRCGGRGGQMCLPVQTEASGWRCETIQRVKPHLLQIDRQRDRQADS